MSSSESDQEPPVKRRKGIVHSETYKRNIIRNARVHGLGYVNYNGKEVPSQTIPQEILCKCAQKCYLKVRGDIVKSIWNNFYSMNSKNVQYTYLQTLIESKPIKRHRVPLSQPVTDADISEESMPAQEVNEIFMPFKKKSHLYI